nr:hypothetical protein [Levilinea saccharolytica]
MEIGIKFNPIGRVNVNHLHLAAQALALGQRGHHLQAVAQDHAVGPVGVVLVKLGSGIGALGQAVEVGEEVQLLRLQFFLAGFGLAAQIIHQHLGVDFFLDVDGRGQHHQVGIVQQVFAAPDELGVEVGVAALVGHLHGGELVFAEDGLQLGGGDVAAGSAGVADGFDCFFLVSHEKSP